MVTKLNYATKYDKALRYIFGKTLICRNLEVATNLAKTSGLDCVTLEGDQVCVSPLSSPPPPLPPQVPIL